MHLVTFHHHLEVPPNLMEVQYTFREILLIRRSSNRV